MKQTNMLNYINYIWYTPAEETFQNIFRLLGDQYEIIK